MREKMIEAIEKARRVMKKANCSCQLERDHLFVDSLIANGVVMPPCQLGDMVRRADGVWTVCGFDCNRGGKWTVKLERWKDQFQDCHEYARAPFCAFGKTVFLVGKPAQTPEK